MPTKDRDKQEKWECKEVGDSLWEISGTWWWWGIATAKTSIAVAKSRHEVGGDNEMSKASQDVSIIKHYQLLEKTNLISSSAFKEHTLIFTCIR